MFPGWLCLSLPPAEEVAAQPGEATGGSPFAYFDKELFFLALSQADIVQMMLPHVHGKDTGEAAPC